MRSTLLSLLLGSAVLACLKLTPALPWLLEQTAAAVLLGLLLLSAVVLLLATRVAHHADELALKLGEPYGTLILTASAIVVELALIASTMTTGEQNPTLARDSMFAVLMIALTGVKGISIFLAAKEQERQLEAPLSSASELASMNLSGSSTYLNLITAISVMALITPNFSNLTDEANFTMPVNVVLSVAAVGLYSVFLTYQTGTYRTLFTESAAQAKWLEGAAAESDRAVALLPSMSLLGAGLLLLVLITESMGQLIETSITDLGLPSSMGGVLVGLLVLAPEALNAFQAASRGEVQRSLNTLYGSALSTLCLTVPAVLLIGELIHTDVILGLDSLEMVLLGLTLFLVRPTSGRVTRIDGLVLLVIFLFWIALQLG